MLNYMQNGDGKTLILLHGNGENLKRFKNQIEFFKDKYRVIAIDTRGHGESPRGDKPFTLVQFCEDLKNFLDKKEIKKANILGFSDGGNIAIYFALKYPEYIDKLILNGANVSPYGMKFKYYIGVLFIYYYAKILSVFNDKYKRKRDLFSLMVKEPKISLNKLKNIKVDTLVIVGSDDMIRHSHSVKIYESIPNAIFKVIDGDHFIVYKKSEEFNKAVLEFLEGK